MTTLRRPATRRGVLGTISRRSFGRRSFGRRDVLLAAAVTAVQFAGPRAGAQVEPPDALAGLAGGLLGAAAVLVQGASLRWRRSRPVPVLAVCAAAYAFQAAVVPGVPPYAGWFALYAAAVCTRPDRRAAVAAVAGGAALVALILAGAAAYPSSGAAPVPPVLATVIVALLGMLVRSRRAQLSALRERAAALEREQDAAVARAAAQERLRIARDLHDVVGHGLSGIAIQSSTARVALDAGQADAARAALASVESTSRAALQEMRQLLGVLRAGDAGESGPTPGLHDIPGIVDRARAQGVPVTLAAAAETETETGGVPAAVSLCAYRVVQEALTNAVRHAPGNRVDVDVAVEVTASGAALVVTVDDVAEHPTPPSGEPGGRPPMRAGESTEPSARDAVSAGGPPGGLGLVGMRERVGALGGELHAGPAVAHPGWRVRARLPYEAPVEEMALHD